MNSNMNIGIRSIVRLLVGLFWVSSFFACGSNDDGNGSDEPQLDAPQLVSSIPVNGDKDIPTGDLEVILTYDNFRCNGRKCISQSEKSNSLFVGTGKWWKLYVKSSQGSCFRSH